MAIALDEGIGASELTQIVQIRIAHDGLPSLARPACRAGVEVEAARPEVAPLHGVEEIRVHVERRSQARAVGEEWMRRDDEPARPRLEACGVVEAANVLYLIGKVDQQHVASVDRALDARDEDDAALARVGGSRAVAKQAVVQRDRNRVEAEARGAIDQRPCVVRNIVDGIFTTVKMKIYFQHRSTHTGSLPVSSARGVPASYRGVLDIVRPRGPLRGALSAGRKTSAAKPVK